MSSFSNFDKVKEFHKLFGHPVKTELYENVFEKEPELVKFRQALINEENKELDDACKDRNIVEVADALSDLLYVIYGAGHVFGINLDKTFEEVHNSNMSKLCSSETEAVETVEWYKKNNDVYEMPTYRKSECGKYWIVYDKKTSKILKSINYRPPVLLQNQQ